MGKIRYTVTTITKRCPYCGKIVDTETHGEFTPLFAIVGVFAFPIALPYSLIRYLGFQNPTFPQIGPKSFPCPHCSSPIRAKNYAVADLKGKDLFLHKFKKWIYISSVERTYRIVRVHEDSDGNLITDVIEGTFDPATKTFTFETDKFSTYALAYADEEVETLGDLDGDEQITVSDALAALRIAAKTAECTPEALRIGDIDGDGVITVADALAILRVAAKIVDSL